MKIVVTGGSGFIGTNLVEWLGRYEPNSEVIILDVRTPNVPLPAKAKYVYGDIRSLNSLLPVFEGVDEVYNLAGILGTSELIPVAALASEINITGAINVLDAARLCNVPRLYNVAKPHFAGYHENAYTLTKHSAEMAGLMYQEKYGMEVATVRWLNAVGPYQHLYPVRKFVPTMVLFALYGVDLEVYGSGDQTIDPIDVRDLSRYTTYACRNLGRTQQVFDLGSGIAVSCNEAVQTILEEVQAQGVNSSSSVVHLPMRQGESEGCKLVADTTFWDSVGIRPQYSFRDSVVSVIQHLLEEPEYHRQNALRFYGKTARHSIRRDL